MKKPIVLTILDGIGLRDDEYGNAVKEAKTVHLDYLWNNYPHAYLIASGEQVGLPKGQMGNSEVGHANIGAGRIVYQPLEYINNEIKTNNIFNNKEILNLFNHVKNNKSKLHIMGLLSDGGVHSHIEHLFALIDMCKKNNVTEVFYHVFLDGRDTLPDSALKYLSALEKKIKKSGIGVITTICGRYYAMDRDNRWDRVKLAYDNIVNSKGIKCNDYKEYIKASYQAGTFDEFIEPLNLYSDGKIESKDGILVFNFRPDRLRELFGAISNPKFKEFKTKKLSDLKLVTMFPVSSEVIYKNAFELEKLSNTLGEYLSKKGYNQLRIAETEKYAHVTYFFDGGEEKELNGAERILVPSPQVSTYDLKPEMSAYQITDILLDKIENYDLIILNFANGDMVGHTGSLKSAIKAVEAVDYNLGRIYDKVKKISGTLIVTADHGNCEEMIDSLGNKLTAHTNNLVPFIVCDKNYSLKDGKLGDIAPTILNLLEEKIPEEMTGVILIK